MGDGKSGRGGWSERGRMEEDKGWEEKEKGRVRVRVGKRVRKNRLKERCIRDRGAEEKLRG